MPDDKLTLSEQVAKECERVAREEASHVTIDANTDSISGEVEVDRGHWSVVGYAKYYWDRTKGWVAGGRATRRW